MGPTCPWVSVSDRWELTRTDKGWWDIKGVNNFIQLPWPLSAPFAGVMGLPYVWRGYPFKAPKIKAEADDAAARKAYREPALQRQYPKRVHPIPWLVTFLEWQDFLVQVLLLCDGCLMIATTVFHIAIVDFDFLPARWTSQKVPFNS